VKCRTECFAEWVCQERREASSEAVKPALKVMILLDI
jgi:hypothetical protein